MPAWRQRRRKMERASWSEADERSLIAFLTDHKAEAGDGFSFKQTTWNAAARYMATQQGQKGAAKTAESCKNKWSRLKELQRKAESLLNQSGFHWSADGGCTINPEDESVWDVYVKSHRNASQLRKYGWPHFHAIHAIMPSAARGRKAYHGTKAFNQPLSQGQPADPLTSMPSTSGNPQTSSQLPVLQNSFAPTPPTSSNVHTLNQLPPHPPITARTLHDLLQSFSPTIPSTSSAAGTISAPMTPLSNQPPSLTINDNNEDTHTVPPASSSAPPSISSLGKRRISPLDDLLHSSSSPSASQVSSRAAKRNPVLELQTQLDVLNSYYKMSLLQTEQQAHVAQRNRKETRIQNARSRAMELESWLGPEAMAALMDILSNPTDVDAYMMYQNEEYRKAWLKRKLKQVGYVDTALTENS